MKTSTDFCDCQALLPLTLATVTGADAGDGGRFVEQLKRPRSKISSSSKRSSRDATRSGALDQRETSKSRRKPRRRQLDLSVPERLSQQFEKRLVGEARWDRMTMTAARERVLPWVADLPTKSADPQARVRRIRDCGQMRVVFNPKLREFAWASTSCKDAACPRCQGVKSRAYARCIAEFLSEGDRRLHSRFLTLSQPKRPGETVGSAMTRLMKSWNRLRNRKVWKSYVLGGVRAVEVTRPKAGDKKKDGHVVRQTGWHVHLHAIVEFKHERARDFAPTLMRGIEQLGLRIMESWCEVSPGSKMGGQDFDPRPLDDDMKAAWYVAKYVTKGFELDDATAREFFSHMVGRRFLDGLGAWRGGKELPSGEKSKGIFAPMKEKAPSDGWVVQTLGIEELWEKATQNLKVTLRWRRVGDRYMSSFFGQQLGGMVCEEDWRARKILFQLVTNSRSVWEARNGTSGHQEAGRFVVEQEEKFGVKNMTVDRGRSPP